MLLMTDHYYLRQIEQYITHYDKLMKFKRKLIYIMGQTYYQIYEMKSPKKLYMK